MSLEKERLVLQRIIREEKEKLGSAMSHQVIADILGKSRSTVSDKILGKNPPSIEMSIEVLTKALDAEVELKVNGEIIIGSP